VPNPILTPELLRRLEQFQLLAARRAKSSAKGERSSRARGQSVEFADYRNYVPGDDFRYLDWNLYGRLERLFLKLYEEERELPVRIFLDASESMTFGEPRKFDFARQVAAALGYVALCGFDRVSVNVFPTAESAGSPKSEVRGPNGGANGENLPPAAWNLEQAAVRGALRSIRGKKSALQFFQNLSALTAGYEGGLNALVGRGFQVDVVQILAPDELAPATYGDLRLVDSESGAHQEVTFGKYRLTAYQKTVQSFIQRLREFCSVRGVNFFMARSDTDLEELLLKRLRKAEVLG
jgi:hypothetical protein